MQQGNHQPRQHSLETHQIHLPNRRPPPATRSAPDPLPHPADADLRRPALRAHPQLFPLLAQVVQKQLRRARLQVHLPAMGPEVSARARGHWGWVAADRAIGWRGFEGGGAGHKAGGRAGHEALGVGKAGDEWVKGGQPAFDACISGEVRCDGEFHNRWVDFESVGSTETRVSCSEQAQFDDDGDADWNGEQTCTKRLASTSHPNANP